MEKQKWLEELAQFIVEANTKGWAAGGSEVEPIFPGMKSIYHQSKDGNWELRDNYFGYFRAPGFTVVSYKQRPVWGMTYFGPGQTPEQENIVKPTFNFLRNALMKVPLEMPFRGPSEYSEGDWVYRFRLLKGDITDFLGEEEVLKKGVLTFAQTIGGGIGIGKSDKREPIHPWNL